MSEFTREEAIQIKALRGRVARLERYLEQALAILQSDRLLLNTGSQAKR